MCTTCQRVGLPPISTSAFGIACVCSCRRAPRPPHRIATGSLPSTAGERMELVAVAGLAARDGRPDGHLVPLLKLGVQSGLEADALSGDVSVHEPAQAAVLGDPLAQVVVLVEDLIERLADGRA